MENPNQPTASAFSWALNKSLFSNTIFGKKKLVEYCDVKKVYGFIKNEMGITYQGNKRYNHLCETHKTELEQMEKFKDIYNSKLKAFQTAIYLPKHKWGRIQPVNHLSLAVFHRPTRHSLCDDVYVDIDMINAQPTIVYQIAKANGENLEHLKKYIDNTKKYREFIMEHHNCSKDTAKNLMISMMMGGSYNSWLKDNDIQQNDDKKIQEIVDMENEFKIVMNIVYINNQQIKKDVLKQDPTKWNNDKKVFDENSAKRGVMGLWGQSVERLCQETAISYLISKNGWKLEDIVPCQDGFMILKDLWYEGVLEDCSLAIKNRIGIEIGFSRKPFDEKFEIPSFEGGLSYAEYDDLLSVKKLGDLFCEKFDKFVAKYQSNVYVFYKGRWYNETDSKERYKFILYISEDLYEIMREKIADDIGLNNIERTMLLGSLRTTTSNIRMIKDIITHILTQVKPRKEDFNQIPYLIGFENGVYDLKEGKFREYKYDDYITLSTGYDYNNKVDYDIEEYSKIRDNLIKIFNDIHNVKSIEECEKCSEEEIKENEKRKENLTLYFQILASGLDGRLYQNLFLFNGEGGNGKGLTSALMKEILGNDYFITANNGIIKEVLKANSASPDVYNLKNKRFINFSEVEGDISSAMIKKFTGGGNISARLLHQNTESFPLNATINMEFNRPPQLDGKPQQAEYRRVIHMFFPVNFTDKKELIGTFNKEKGVWYKEGNKSYEQPEFYKSVRDVFLNMLLQIYSENYDKKEGGIKFIIPEEIRHNTNNFLKNQNLFNRLFDKYYEKEEVVPNTKPNVIKNKDVWSKIECDEEYRNLTYKEKREYNRTEFNKWIDGEFGISDNKDKVQVIKGFKLRDNDDN